MQALTELILIKTMLWIIMVPASKMVLVYFWCKYGKDYHNTIRVIHFKRHIRKLHEFKNFHEEL